MWIPSFTMFMYQGEGSTLDVSCSSSKKPWILGYEESWSASACSSSFWQMESSSLTELEVGASYLFRPISMLSSRGIHGSSLGSSVGAPIDRFLRDYRIMFILVRSTGGPTSVDVSPEHTPAEHGPILVASRWVSGRGIVSW